MNSTFLILFVRSSSGVNYNFPRRLCPYRLLSLQNRNSNYQQKSPSLGNDDEFSDYFYQVPDDLVKLIPEKSDFIFDVIREMDIRRFQCLSMPQTLSFNQWKKLLNTSTIEDREILYQKFYLKERSAALRRMIMIKQESELQELEKFEECNTIFSRSFLGSLRNKCMLNAVKAHIFGPHVIIDCSYEDYMDNKEMLKCTNQVLRLNKRNRSWVHPFNIIHCNIQTNGPMISKIRQITPDLLDSHPTFHYTEKSYIDLFPRDRLIYLSPHAEVELEKYDDDKIYIIGAFVDLKPRDGISNIKAKTHGVETMKLPLDRYLNWCKGTKCLCLDDVVKLLNRNMCGMSWENSLKLIKISKLKYSSFDTKICQYHPIMDNLLHSENTFRYSYMSNPFYRAVNLQTVEEI